MEEMQIRTYDLLHQLGVTANYTGFFHTACAVAMAKQQPDRLLLVTKWLYPDIARQFGTTWQCVERNIRTVISLAWARNRKRLEELAGYPLEKKPSVGQFIAILVYHLDRVKAA